MEIANEMVKHELAREIISRLIAISCKDGFNPNDKTLQILLNDEKLIKSNDEETINKVVNEYSKILKAESGAR